MPAVRLRHVLRHAVLPAVTLSGWALGATLSGAVVVESIFSRPGIGSVLVTAVNSQDLPVVVGIVTLVAAFYVVANLLVDIAYTLIDPRLACRMTAVRETAETPRTARAASPSPAVRAARRARPDRLPGASPPSRPSCSRPTTRSRSTTRTRCSHRRPPTGSAPTSPVATSTAGSSTAPGSRCSSDSARPRSASSSRSCSARSPPSARSRSPS